MKASLSAALGLLLMPAVLAQSVSFSETSELSFYTGTRTYRIRRDT